MSGMHFDKWMEHLYVHLRFWNTMCNTRAGDASKHFPSASKLPVRGQCVSLVNPPDLDIHVNCTAVECSEILELNLVQWQHGIQTLFISCIHIRERGLWELVDSSFKFQIHE